MDGTYFYELWHSITTEQKNRIIRTSSSAIYENGEKATCCAEDPGEISCRQQGQLFVKVLSSLFSPNSHSSTHALWKQWEQGRGRSSSPSLNASKHIPEIRHSVVGASNNCQILRTNSYDESSVISVTYRRRGERHLYA